ncbi:hypothetical protein [Roseomonas sp. USHLN139]|uniref:hypothetical protein n=1 Tax=Roseomonas sp. USHLN139 TaxID=3081298 RepID=UPI003B0120BE
MHLFDPGLAQGAYEATFACYPSTLLPALRAHDSIGTPKLAWLAERDTFNHEVAENYGAVVGKLMGLTCTNERTWTARSFLHDVLSIAQTDFAVIDCRAERREDSLTGSLITRIWTAAAMLNMRVEEKEGGPLGHVCLIELIGHGLEQKTGGDLALVHDNGDWQLGFCFQAKRVRHGGKDA